MKTENLSWIAEADTANTGGWCMVDLLTLRDGRVIAISDEYVGLYDSVDAFWYDCGEDCRAGFWIPTDRKPEVEA